MAEKAPVWQELLKRALIEKSDYSVAFALGTITLNGKPSVRYVGLKEVISIPSSANDISHSVVNSEPLDASTIESARRPEFSALVFTTDVRSPKCAEIQRNPACSLSTWAPESGIQLRIDGTAYIYKPAWSQQGAHPPEVWLRPDMQSSPSAPVVNKVESIIHQADLEVHSRALFDGLHSRTRAWHTRGIPGNPMDSYTQGEKEKWLEELQAGDSAETEAARNFALLLVVPEEVDIVQIVARGHDRRWHWKLSRDLSWTVTELVP
ncbi:hypothetical protein QFC21_001271 [Naganishia friedmannii]|uniref:Uncharacterized protein n=1 Tax=Naganishia friedmannii TaxID=89922 RepID=A0ACC2W4B7_9TREE|nr:hypothetical protein QFC21_001271 [Naganishia friedmannii]